MSRQRRMDAIARRRAFIDSQIQLMTSHETRVPNIIRNRSSWKPQPRYRSVIVNPPEYEDDIYKSHTNMLLVSSTASNTDQQQQGIKKLKGGAVEEEANLSETHSNDEPKIRLRDIETLTESPDSEQSNDESSALINEDINHQQARQEEVVTISNSEIAELLASATASSLQTIQTEDGTVMVVLEGGEWNENNFIQIPEMGSKVPSEGCSPATCVSEEETNNIFNTAAESDSLEPRTPEFNSHHHVRENEEETYVIVQTANGNILIPSSSLTSQIESESSAPSPPEEETTEIKVEQPKEKLPTGSNIVELIASEGANIENLMRKRNCAHSSVPVDKRPKLVQQSKTPQKVVPVKSKVGINQKRISTKSQPAVYLAKNNTSKEKLKTDLRNNSTTIKPAITVEEVKPGPFRFELPEFDNNLNDDVVESFLRVPIPIVIDSLQSQIQQKSMATSTTANKELNKATLSPTNPSNIQEKADGRTNGAVSFPSQPQPADVPIPMPTSSSLESLTSTSITKHRHHMLQRQQHVLKKVSTKRNKNNVLEDDMDNLERVKKGTTKTYTRKGGNL